ncbi:MAG TPA: alpha/beta hydrolase [Chloroflexota bacterium]|nr:alpha/beta hydrolase [Chloroflexota bacterium]
MPLQYETHTAQVNGCDLHYVALGSGPPLVFLHGSGGLRLDEQAFGLLARHYRLLVPSMPGFDASTIGSVASGPDTADVMAAFIGQCAGGSAHVVGESFGGRIAAWLAIRQPAAVRRAVLAAPGGLRRGGGEQRVGLSPDELHRRLFGRPLDRPPTEAEQRQRQANLATAIRLSGPPWDEDLYQQLPAIRCPTLVLYGTADQTLPREGIELFATRIPGARLYCFEGAPHVLSATVPEPFVAAVEQFLAGQDAPSAAPA